MLCVTQECLISKFLFNFAIDDFLETALMDVGNGSVDLLSGEKLFDFEYVDDIVLPCNDTQTMKFSLDQLKHRLRWFGHELGMLSS
ncbi:unnamed protein product [Schistosoma mattheei]|uniref:Uncharacterized protein n=1 Tax=Schistosoma mattheei TaxID=31246 RepID=A0A183NMH6_9TREM|nr:unnamed protein product [Schistosoma mattheei]